MSSTFQQQELIDLVEMRRSALTKSISKMIMLYLELGMEITGTSLPVPLSVMKLSIEGAINNISAEIWIGCFSSLSFLGEDLRMFTKFVVKDRQTVIKNAVAMFEDIVDVGLNLMQASTTVAYVADKLDMRTVVPKEWDADVEEIDEDEIGQVVTSSSFVLRVMQMFSYYSSKKKRLNCIRDWLVRLLSQLVKEQLTAAESNEEFILESMVSLRSKIPLSASSALQNPNLRETAQEQLEDGKRLLRRCIQYLDHDLLKRPVDQKEAESLDLLRLHAVQTDEDEDEEAAQQVKRRRVD